MKKRLTGRVLFVGVVLGCTAWLTPAATAQVSNLEQGTFIDGLRREGMGELLIHYADTRTFPDPKVPRQIIIAQHLLEYKTKFARSAEVGAQSGLATDPNEQLRLQRESVRLLDEARNHFDSAIAEQLRLIGEFRDYPMRPVWQTDLAELLLLDKLAIIHNSAADFYEFGITTVEQKKAYEAAVTQAYEQLVDANARFNQLQGDLPRQADFAERFDSTGLYELLMNKYWRTRTQYFLANAGYYLALAPNDIEYYKTLGKNAVIPAPLQAKSPNEERRKLLEKAAEAVAPFVADANDTQGLKVNSQSLTGRVYIEQSKTKDAIKMLEAVTALRKGDIIDLISSLALAKAYDADGQEREADSLLNGLSRHTVVSQNLLYRLLVIDQDHRLLLGRAEKLGGANRVAAIESAYQPYVDLLSDNTLSPEVAANLENYVGKRWEANLSADQKLTDLPSVVLMLVGKIAQVDGQNIVVQANQMLNAANARLAEAADRGASQRELDELQTEAERIESESDALRSTGEPKLNRAIEVLDILLARTNLNPAIRADAMYYKGLAIYFLTLFDEEGIVKAAKVFIELAQKLPEQKQSEKALSIAVGEMLLPLHQRNPRPMGVDEPFNAAVELLLEKYPQSAGAENIRLYYAMSVLMASGDYDRASQVLSQVPSNHLNYFEARREMLFAMLETYRSAEGVVKSEAAHRVIEAGQKLIADSKVNLPGAGPDEARIIRNAVANAKLVIAEVASETGDGELANQVLQNFEQDYADMPDMVRQALGRRIMAQVAARNYDQAVIVARQMMDQVPNEAAWIIESIMTRSDQRITTLRRKIAESQVDREKAQFDAEIRTLAEGTVHLSRLLLDWANQQSLEQLLAQWNVQPGDDAFLDSYVGDRVPWKIPYIRSLALSGRHDDALAVLQPLTEKYSSDADLLLLLGDTYFAKGDEQSLIYAATQAYDQLISALNDVDANAEPDLKRVFWYAWMRRLQISEKLDSGTEDIALRVAQLRLSDANLGGEPYRSELERLASKYATQAR